MMALISDRQAVSLEACVVYGVILAAVAFDGSVGGGGGGGGGSGGCEGGGGITITAIHAFCACIPVAVATGEGTAGGGPHFCGGLSGLD